MIVLLVENLIKKAHNPSALPLAMPIGLFASFAGGRYGKKFLLDNPTSGELAGALMAGAGATTVAHSLFKENNPTKKQHWLKDAADNTVKHAPVLALTGAGFGLLSNRDSIDGSFNIPKALQGASLAGVSLLTGNLVASSLSKKFKK